MICLKEDIEVILGRKYRELSPRDLNLASVPAAHRPHLSTTKLAFYQLPSDLLIQDFLCTLQP